MITKNKMVSVSYELRTEQNGELLEAAGADRPLDFICGQGQTLEYFEMNLLDKNEGDKFDFSIPAACLWTGERRYDCGFTPGNI